MWCYGQEPRGTFTGEPWGEVYVLGDSTKKNRKTKTKTKETKKDMQRDNCRLKLDSSRMREWGCFFCLVCFFEIKPDVWADRR